MPAHPPTSPLRPRIAGCALLALGVGALVAGPAGGASSSSLPTTPPVDAAAAGLTVLNQTIASNAYKPTGRGFTGTQTVTVRAPAGKQILQGFATLSGGNTGSVLIRSTQTVGGSRFVVRLVFPGEQGRPGVLRIRVQLLPKE